MSCKAARRVTADAIMYGNRQDPAKPQASSVEGYFQDMPSEFIEIADVELCIGGKRLPAHSQFLASQSRFMAKMFEDLQVFPSKTERFIVPEEILAGFTISDVVRFLSQVYNFGNQPIRSATEAHQLFLLAELFGSEKLKKSCTTFLSCNANTFLQANVMEEGVLKWFLFAEKYDLALLRQTCITFVAANYQSIKADERLKLLPSSALLGVMSLLEDARVAAAQAPRSCPSCYCYC